MGDTKTGEKRPPGRPREFDLDAALDRAAAVFWAKGFAGASFRDLTEAMGISPPSLCAAFGDKHGLFLAAVDHYANAASRALGAALTGTGDLASDLASFYAAVIDRASGCTTPSGCLVTNVLADAAEADAACRGRLRAIVEMLDTALARRFAAAGFAPHAARARAQLAAAAMHDLAVRARAGLARGELEAVAASVVGLLSRPDQDSHCPAPLPSRPPRDVIRAREPGDVK